MLKMPIELQCLDFFLFPLRTVAQVMRRFDAKKHTHNYDQILRLVRCSSPYYFQRQPSVSCADLARALAVSAGDLGCSRLRHTARR